MTKQATTVTERIENAINERFGEHIAVTRKVTGSEELARIVEHRSHRKYTRDLIDAGLLRLLFACALSAPSKSDLQQADIVQVSDRFICLSPTALSTSLASFSLWTVL